MSMKVELDRERMVINEFPQPNQELPFFKEEEREKKRVKLWRIMDSPVLSLGPSQLVISTESSNCLVLDSNMSPHRKRKYRWDHFKSEAAIRTDIELQLKDPLPLDWEQCLDLESGRMYYFNRKTLKKSWSCPKDQELDLELNISTYSSSDARAETNGDTNNHNNSCSSMIAVACHKCHLLVMLSKTSPSCPNCKYLHLLPAPRSAPPKVTTPKPLETLSLLN